MTNEELRSVAEIVERLVTRFHEQLAEHEAKMVELGARTSADAKIIEGLRAAADEQVLSASKVAYVLRCAGETPVQAAQRVVKERDGLLTQVQDQRAEIERLRNDERKAYQDGEALRAEVADLRGIVDMVHASLGIKRGDHIGNAIAQLKAQTPKRSHPVAVGEYLRRLTGFSTTPAGEVAQVLHVDCDAPTTEYTVKRPNGQQGVWFESGCEPCDPPATHDTEAGKAVAESAVSETVADEIKVGDVVKVVGASGDLTAQFDIGKIGEVLQLDSMDGAVRLSGGAGWVNHRDVRKVTT